MITKGLCEISSPKQWKTISTDMLIDSGYPVYGANGIIGFYSEYNHERETLQYINYLVFKYTENYYAAPSLKEEIVKHPLLQQLCKEVNDYPDFGFVGLEEMQNPPPGVQMHEIPNFLTPRYAIT